MCVNTLDSAESDQNNKENYISDSDTSDKTHKSNETEVNSSSDNENEEVPLMVICGSVTWWLRVKVNVWIHMKAFSIDYFQLDNYFQLDKVKP